MSTTEWSPVDAIPRDAPSNVESGRRAFRGVDAAVVGQMNSEFPGPFVTWTSKG